MSKLRRDSVSGLIMPDSSLVDPNEIQLGSEKSGLLGGTTSTIDLSKYKTNQTQVIGQFGENFLATQASDEQGLVELTAKGIGNAINTGLSEIAKMPGYLGGGIWDVAEGVQGQGWDFNRTVNNALIRGVDEAKGEIKERLLHITRDPKFEEKGLGAQLLDPTFWATEGADGVGFLLSFLVPGQLVKAGKLGQSIAKGAGKLGIGADLGRLANNINSSSAVALNTFMESAAEGAGTFSEVYERSIAEGLSEQQANEKASKAASKVVAYNLPVLTMSNLFVEKYIMKGFNRLSGKRGMARITDDVITGKSQLAKLTARQKLGRYTSGTGAAFAQEGLYEEGLQTTIEQVSEELEGSLQDILTIGGKYWENVSGMFGKDQQAKQFGRAAFLGGVLGGGMGAIGQRAENKREGS
jgi:hypothetical protein